MRIVFSVVVLLAALAGCGGSEPAPKTPADGCEPLAGDPEALYAEAETFEVTGEEHSPARKESRAKKIELYKRAAAAGHIEGQYKAGSMLFGDLYQVEAPKPEQRDAYVEAVMLVMTAAARRDDKGQLASSIGNAKELPAKIDGPLADLPREWVEAAFSQSRKWLACYAPGWDSN